MIEIILTVCAISNPANCEEKYLQFDWDGSPRQCMMAAQPYIAEWIGKHPEWVARKWSCDYPGNEKRRIWCRPGDTQMRRSVRTEGHTPGQFANLYGFDHSQRRHVDDRDVV